MNEPIFWNGRVKRSSFHICLLSINKSIGYFPDFWVKMITQEKKIINVIVEVKPEKQTMAPKKPSRITKRYITELRKWAVNSAKWEAAESYCTKHGMIFEKMTEVEIFGKRDK